mmetsp:Transcript_7404/g.10922  ORF Transcript_7404/g.10922 Transcript_7404/m.10922 type:complete len:155 (+) Transcript_7404:3283-3747(+)
MKFLLALTLIILSAFYVTAWPNAYCNVRLTFSEFPCEKLFPYFENTIKNYTFPGVREPDYNFISSDPMNSIVYTHETPTQHYVDDGKLIFSPSGSGCTVDGYSKSRATSIKDYSTNFCNTYRLLYPGSLTDAPTISIIDKSSFAGTDKSACMNY